MHSVTPVAVQTVFYRSISHKSQTTDFSLNLLTHGIIIYVCVCWCSVQCHHSLHAVNANDIVLTRHKI